MSDKLVITPIRNLILSKNDKKIRFLKTHIAEICEECYTKVHSIDKGKFLPHGYMCLSKNKFFNISVNPYALHCFNEKRYIRDYSKEKYIKYLTEKRIELLDICSKVYSELDCGDLGHHYQSIRRERLNKLNLL